MMFTTSDHARIAQAIAAAEAHTSGEIFAIVEMTQPRYRVTALAGATLAALTLPLAAVLAGFDPQRLIPFDGGWATNPSPLRAIEAFAALQAVLFAVVLALLALTPLGALLTPRALKRQRVHRLAMQQFLAKGLHVTAARTGVLLFVSLPDHVAEVIADAGIYAKVPPETWGETVAAVIDGVKAGRPADGFVTAIGIAGRVLAEHFPPHADNPNELPDKLVEL